MFVDGLLVNVLNPKVGVFFLAFLPQFAPDARPVDLLLIGCVFFGVALSFDLVYAVAGSELSGRLHRGQQRRSIARFLVAAIYVALAGYTVATTW